MPRVRDHDPRYCPACQFWFAFYRAAGAVLGVVAALVVLALVLGALALVGFFWFLR